MNRKIHTLLDKIESQISITDTLMKELQSEMLQADMQDEASLTASGNQVATLCDYCSGDGKMWFDKTSFCPRCGGTGKLSQQLSDTGEPV